MQLLVRPPSSNRTESYGFHFLGFRTQRLTPKDRVEEDTGDRELGIVLLGGKCSVESSRGTWTNIGRRPNVFSGMPYALYLPISTHYSVTTGTECDLAFCYCRAQRVRHVQSARQGYRNPGSGAGAKVGRQERRLPEKRQAKIAFYLFFAMASNVKILLVDDNPMVLGMLQQALSALGEVAVAT